MDFKIGRVCPKCTEAIREGITNCLFNSARSQWVLLIISLENFGVFFFKFIRRTTIFTDPL